MTQELAEQVLEKMSMPRDPSMDAEMIAVFYDKLLERHLPEHLIEQLCIAYLVRR